MLRVLGLRSSVVSLDGDQKTQRILEYALKLEKALKAMDYVMDDRPDEAKELLKDHNEVSISEVAYGVSEFLDATLGFEADTMHHASEILSQAETMSWKDKTISEKNKIGASAIYPPGTEYTVQYAEANLLNALLMLMSENLVEAAKALLKLRRAYHALDTLSKSMEKMNHGEYTTIAEAVDNLGAGYSLAGLANQSTDSVSSGASSLHFADYPHPLSEQQLQDKQVISKLESIYRMRKARIGGSHIGNPPALSSLRDQLGAPAATAAPGSALKRQLTRFGNPEIASVDEYIHSGVNLCFGILQVVLSLLPPGLGKVLYIVGFKGSRENGLKMLWKAAHERNIHGGIALLTLLIFYDGPFQFNDVDFDAPSIPEAKHLRTLSQSQTTGAGAGVKETTVERHRSVVLEEGSDSDLDSFESAVGNVAAEDVAANTSNSTSSVTSSVKQDAAAKMELERKATRGGEPTLLHPGAKLERILLRSRALFPNSNLWLLMESRMLASKGEIKQALSILLDPTPSNMTQIDALMLFDRCLFFTFLHRYERAAKEWLHLIEVNSYSHALYTYFAAGCYLEAYRMCETGTFLESAGQEPDAVDPAKKDEYKKLAEECFLRAPELAGKKKLMAKVPPFEKFVVRKMKEIFARKTATGLPLIECVGTSPVHELIYFWNGYNRMPENSLRLSVKLLGYGASQVKYPALDLVNPATGKPYSHFAEPLEQAMIRYTLQAISIRRLGELKEGNRVLEREVIAPLSESGKAGVSEKLKKLTANPWLYPTALYEKSLFCWKLNGVDGLKESVGWLKKAQAYGGDDYELRIRVSLKIKAALDRLEDMKFK